MCERAVKNKSYNLKSVPDHFETQEICDKAVRVNPSSLQYVPNWFVTREWVYICYDDREYCDDDDDNYIKCYEGYKRCKAQKASIKGETGVCPKMKKGMQKHCGHKHRLFCIL